MAELKKRGLLVENDGFGAQTGGISAKDEHLDEIVSEGIRSGALRIA